MMNRTLFKDFQKVCVTAVQTEAILHGIKEYSIEARERKTKITIYAKKFAASVTLYISGRLVIEESDSAGSGKYKVVSVSSYDNDKILSVSFLLRDVVIGFFGLMSDKLHTKVYNYEKEIRERYLQNLRSAENTENKGDMPLTEVSPDSYLDVFDVD